MKDTIEAKEFRDKLTALLKTDPNAPDHHKNYRYLEDYLFELDVKDGSVLSGLLVAIETYLEK